MYLYSADIEEEDPRVAWRRRLQQRRCLVCGARELINPASYFCATHIRDWRFCSQCETLRPIDAHGRDGRCKPCSAARSLAMYYANAERNIYRTRLRELAKRQHSRSEQIFIGIRRRIALADLVASTPGWSWRRRAALSGGYAWHLAARYREQLRGMVRDADEADRMRPGRREHAND